MEYETVIIVKETKVFVRKSRRKHEDCQDEFVIRSGYRLIPGTKCKGGLRYKYQIVKYPKELIDESALQGVRRRLKENAVFLAIWVFFMVFLFFWKRHRFTNFLEKIRFVDGLQVRLIII